MTERTEREAVAQIVYDTWTKTVKGPEFEDLGQLALVNPEDYDAVFAVSDRIIAERIAPLRAALAKAEDERDQFLEQALLRDKRDEEIQLIMKISNEHLARATAFEALIEECGEALKPFAKAARAIPPEIDDNLWTECKTREYHMSDAKYEYLLKCGVPLLGKETSVVLWIDGHPVRDFRCAAALLAKLHARKDGQR